jgi:cobalt transporter subunit CbtB|tara:strand:+ start:419 stop:601 length:183 start_codon:yes stop_codon:yes gene_type:complete
MKERTAKTQDALIASSSKVMPALVALLFGAFLIIGVGFAHSDTIHNAAHDSRHSFAFPCH